MSENMNPDFIEKRFFWGMCYGVLDPKRMAAVIIKRGGEENGKPLRDRALTLLQGVENGAISIDPDAQIVLDKMREWGIPG